MTRRGLTLVESLAAVVLLAMLSAAASGLFRDALRAAEPPTPKVQIADLDALADELLDNPDSFGLTMERLRTEGLDGPLPPQPGLPPVRVTAVRADGADHAWIAFECAGRFALRSIALREDR